MTVSYTERTPHIQRPTKDPSSSEQEFILSGVDDCVFCHWSKVGKGSPKQTIPDLQGLVTMTGLGLVAKRTRLGVAEP
jgi:hypothetical protein